MSQLNGPRDRESDASGTILVVDDEPHLVGMYAAMLEDDHTVHTATSGEAALDQFAASIDIVLLDRRMPGLTGDEVLETIRAESYECRVAMVTSVEPDMDIVDLPFDAYLVKPIRQRDLVELVDDLLLRSQYSAGLQKLLRVSSKLAALESQFSAEKLDSHEEYRDLRAQKERLEEVNHERQTELIERGDTELVFRDVFEEVENV
ncbi:MULTISPECIES: response regulator [Haloarcula]|uniref:response regulator n=1 Tax=Haloarcula TaxID=2237 RepID=UPI0023ECA5B7|nr:response regulator [Halomicroarcula sp. XH51]